MSLLNSSLSVDDQDPFVFLRDPPLSICRLQRSCRAEAPYEELARSSPSSIVLPMLYRDGVPSVGSTSRLRSSPPLPWGALVAINNSFTGFTPGIAHSPDFTSFHDPIAFSDVLHADDGFVYPFAPELSNALLPLFPSNSAIVPGVDAYATPASLSMAMDPTTTHVAEENPPLSADWELDSPNMQSFDYEEPLEPQLASPCGVLQPLSSNSWATGPLSSLPSLAGSHSGYSTQGLYIAGAQPLHQDRTLFDMLGLNVWDDQAFGPYPFAPDFGDASLPQFPSQPIIESSSSSHATNRPSTSTSHATNRPSTSIATPPPGNSSHGMTRPEAKARCVGLVQKTFKKEDGTTYEAFPCPIPRCTRSYSDTRSVIRHMAEVRGVCPVCRKTYTRGQRGYLKQHLRGGPKGCKGPPTGNSTNEDDANDEAWDAEGTDSDEDND